MEAFFSYMKVATITGGIIIALFLILLALPASRIRGFLLQIFFWIYNAFTGLCLVYMLNPMDLIPDFIPVIVQIDDGAALLTAIFSGIASIATAILSRSNRNYLESRQNHPQLED